VETTAGTSVDVIEIDGASNRGIEHIRELRETVKYAPVGGKNKVYVIDEVHMLTNEAFNALLKTLEEPPPHVIFIFATTEPQKIPATIHSRCQRYGFKRIALQEIAAKLREITDKEGIKVSDQGLTMIARAAEGSMRDSQSLLDHAVSYSGMEIKNEDLQAILGAIAQETLRTFAESLLARDSAGLLRQIDVLLEQGQDLRQLLAGVVEHIRNLIVSKIAKEPEKIVELPAADLEALGQQAAGSDSERLLMLFDSLSRTLDEMRWSPHQRFTLEVGMVKACSLASLRPIGEVVEQLRTIETRLGAGAPNDSTRAEAVRERPSGYAALPAHQTPASAARPATTAGQGDSWGRILGALKQKRPNLSPALLGSKIVEQTDDALVIGIKGSSFQVELVEKKESRELIEQLAYEVLGKRVQITFRLLAAEPAKEARPAVPKKAASAEPDLLVQDALSIFNGQIVDPDSQE